MKFKLDENFGARTAPLFIQFGYEVETVRDEGLSGASDATIFEVCARERRCLVTLDLDFADVIRFPPHEAAGIAVLRPPNNVSLALLTEMVRLLLVSSAKESIEGRLWVVEVGRTRVHESTADTQEDSGG